MPIKKIAKSFIFAVHKADYERLWATAVIKKEWEVAASSLAKRIILGKSRYEAVANALRKEIPYIEWWIIGVIHHMEAGCDFNKYQVNGEKVGTVTKLVPKGLKFDTWEESAIYGSRKHLKELDGSRGRLLALLEGFNGYGYRLYHPLVKSPYLWSGTQHYVKGKYAADGKWDGNLVSKQCGIVPILKKLGV